MIKSDIWRYIVVFVRVVRWRAALALISTVCLSFTEGVGVLMLVPLLKLAGLEIGEGSLGQIDRFLSSIFTALGLRPTLVTVLAVFVIVVGVRGLLQRWQSTLNFTLQYGFVSFLRQRLYRSITDTSWQFFSRSRSSDFINALTAELDRVGAATFVILSLFVSIIVSLIYLLFAFRLSLMITALVVSLGFPLMLLLRKKTNEAHMAGGELSEAMDGLYLAVTEHLGGMKTAKSHGVEKRHGDFFKSSSDDILRISLSSVGNRAEVKHWFELGAVSLLAVVLYICFEVLYVSTGEVFLLFFLFVRIMPMFSSIQQNYQSFVNLLPSFTKVMDMQAHCEAAAEPKPERLGIVKFQNSIRLENVSFSYEGDGKSSVVYELDLVINAGETTAVVGQSGAGKSTIADLVIGLLQPHLGRVFIDEIPLSPDLMKSWRSRIGYVTQDTFLFHDTVRANLLWMCPEASEEELSQALKLAAADEFVSRLPRGLDTVVGDRGVLLSGGQRQRLALARALLRKPSLLILDEATSDLDSENEKRILTAIDKLHGRMTILIITHRLSTIRGSDVIYVIHEGRVAESGSWNALMAKENGMFRELGRAQGIAGDGGISFSDNR